MLGSNSRAQYLGELNRMFRDDAEACSLCTKRGQWCPVFHNMDKVRPRDVHQVLLERTERQVIVDNSKSLTWARKSLDRPFDKRFIHLLRDPRAVVYSWQRRGRTKGIEQWIEENYAIRQFLTDAGLDYRVVTYNELADHTDETMERLCSWLGLAYEQRQMVYWEFEHHGAGRNGATASFLRDYVASDEAYYAEHRRQAFHDKRWQSELETDVKEAILRSPRLQQFLDDFRITLTPDGLEPKLRSASPG